jgi:hypothetical protein
MWPAVGVAVVSIIVVLLFRAFGAVSMSGFRVVWFSIWFLYKLDALKKINK